MNRYVYIGLIVVAVIVLAGLLFFAISRNQTTPPGSSGSTGSLPSTGTQSNPGGLQSGTSTGITAQVAVKSFGVISSDPVFDYFVDAKNNTLIVKPDGTIDEVTGGQTSPLSSSQISGLIKASFSYDGEKVLVNFGDPTNPQSSVFDVATKAWTPLPQGLFSPAFSPSDYRIAYLAKNTAETMTIATLDVSNIKKAPVSLIALDTQDLTLRWFNKSQIVLSDKASVYTTASAWLYDLQKQTLTPLVFEKMGSESIWTGATSSTVPMGLVFGTTATARGGTLQLEDTSGNVLQNLNVNTLPSKCTFNSELASSSAPATTMASLSATGTVPSTTSTKVAVKAPVAAAASTTLFLYCGIPRDQSDFSFSRLPDDYEQRALYTSDDIYKIDVTNGSIATVLNDPTQNLDVSDVNIFNGTLFFVNRYDQKLYGLTFN